MPYQLTFPEVTEFESLTIMEKRSRVALATAAGLDSRDDDVLTVEYVSNPVRRIIEWVKTADMEWVQRQRLTREFPWKPTEVVQFQDLRQINRDLLPVQAFVDQGTSQPMEPKFPSERSLQNECVMGRDGHLLAFHLNDEEFVPLHHQLDWVIEQGFTPYPELWIEAFKSLDLDLKTVIKLKDSHMDLCDIQTLVDSLPPALIPERKKQDIAALDMIDVSEYTADSSLQQELRRVIKSNPEEAIEDDEPPAEIFGLHPLHYEEDGCSHEFLSFLRFASIDEIKRIMKGFFPQKNEHGTVCRPRFWYLTSSQKAQAWEYINARRTRLGIFSRKINFTSTKRGAKS